MLSGIRSKKTTMAYLGNIVGENMILAHIVDEAAKTAKKPAKHKID